MIFSRVSIQYTQDDLKILHNLSSFWEVILHENTARYQCLSKTVEEKNKCYWKVFCEGDHCYRNDRIHKNMGQSSQTTYPLHSGQSLNLAGDEITNSHYKRILRRVNPYYHDQLCHSLLHVPYHLPTITGPQPVALLSLENKLEKDNNGLWKVKAFPEGTKGVAFTEEEEQTAKDLIKRIFEEELKDIIYAFEYLPSSK